MIEKSSSLVAIVPGRTDADLKRRAVELHAPILALLEEADAAGFMLGVSCGKGPPFGKFCITSVQVSRVY